MEPLTVWRCREGRRGLGVAFSYHRLALGLDGMRVRSDESVIGSEFVNFVATVITTRLVKAFDAASLLDRQATGRSWRSSGAP